MPARSVTVWETWRHVHNAPPLSTRTRAFAGAVHREHLATVRWAWEELATVPVAVTLRTFEPSTKATPAAVNWLPLSVADNLPTSAAAANDCRRSWQPFTAAANDCRRSWRPFAPAANDCPRSWQPLAADANHYPRSWQPFAADANGCRKLRKPFAPAANHRPMRAVARGETPRSSVSRRFAAICLIAVSRLETNPPRGVPRRSDPQGFVGEADSSADRIPGLRRRLLPLNAAFLSDHGTISTTS